MQYESFDINSNNEAFNKPNMQLVFGKDIEIVYVFAQDKNGNVHREEYHLSEDGKGWNLVKSNNPNEKWTDREIAEDYFNGCYENGDFDEKLIKNMSVRHGIPVSEIKAAIVSHRNEFSSKRNKADMERD